MIYSENNITFNNVVPGKVSVGIGGPLTAKTKYKLNEDGTILHRDSAYLVNAIDIHWKNVIVSTSDLLNIINSLQQKINELESKYSELESSLQNFANNI